MMKFSFFLLFLVSSRRFCSHRGHGRDCLQSRDWDDGCKAFETLAFQSSKCENLTKKRNNIIKNCQNIKCPPVDEPACARVTSSINKESKPLYIIMVNRCEMEYMKCHKGLQASIVDMKNCGHEEYETLKKLLISKGQKRVKRYAHSGPSKVNNRSKKAIIRSDNTTVLTGENSNDIEISPDNTDVLSGLKDSSESTEVEDESNGPSNPNLKFQEIDVKKDLPELNAGDIADDKLPDVEVTPIPDKVTHLPSLQMPDMPVDDLPENMESGHVIVDSLPSGENDNTENMHEELKKKMIFKNKKIIAVEENVSDDYAAYQAECPKSCPTRDVMVCAKCQHNIYKTFMSICHMRMFSCAFTDEKLELVSRYPCVMSAPFLSTKPNTEPQGRITLAEDEDKILKFIYCREKGDPNLLGGKNMILFSEDNAYPKCGVYKKNKRKLKSDNVEQD